MQTSLKVLLVEDNPNDSKLVLRELKHAGFEVIPQRVDSEAAFLASLTGELDFILSDFAMPGFDGMRALALLKKSGLDVPFILVSGTVGEDVAVEAMRQGASDYLLKDRLARLGPAVRHALEQTRLRKERTLTAEELRLTHEKLRHLLAHSPAVIYTLKIDGQTITPAIVSDNIERLLGFTVREASDYDWWVNHIHPDDCERVLASAGRNSLHNSYCIEYRIRHKDGTYSWVEDNNRVVADDSSQKTAVGVWTDITERKRAEDARRVSEERLRLVTENARVGLVMLNSERRYIYANATYVEILGLPSPGIIGQRVADVLRPLYEGQIRPHLDRAFAGERLAYELHKPDPGGDRFYAVRYEPTKANDAEPLVLVVITDITKQKEAHDEIENQLAELQRWHEAMLGREERVLELKSEVNEVLARQGEPARYDAPVTP